MINPTKVEFESPDHAGAARYEIGFFTDVAATSPMFVAVVPKAFVTGANPTLTAPLPHPTFGPVVVRMQVVGLDINRQEVASGWSVVSDVADFKPSPPTAFRLL